MATLQPTIQTQSSHKLVYAALVALVAAAAVTIVLLATNGSTSAGTSSGTSSAPVSTFQLRGNPQQQLQAVSGARFGSRPFHASESPQQQLQAVAGARFGVSQGNR